jgi:hypothetical protein
VNDTSSQLPSTPHLPCDVIESIFDHLDPSTHPTTPVSRFRIEQNDARWKLLTALSPLCGISHALLIPARRLLYRVIPDLTLCGSGRFTTFCKTVREVPGIRKYIRLIYVLPRYYSWTEEQFEIMDLLPDCLVIVPNDIWIYTSASSLLPRFESLAAISLCGVAWDPLTWITAFTNWSLVQSMTLNATTADNFPTQAQIDIAESLSVLPSLRTLAVSGALVIPPTCPNTLHTLSFADGWSIPTFHPILSLLHRHSQSLRILNLEGYVPRQRRKLGF